MQYVIYWGLLLLYEVRAKKAEAWYPQIDGLFQKTKSGVGLVIVYK